MNFINIFSCRGNETEREENWWHGLFRCNVDWIYMGNWINNLVCDDHFLYNQPVWFVIYDVLVKMFAFSYGDLHANRNKQGKIQKDRQTERQRDRHREKQTETDTKREKQTLIWKPSKNPLRPSHTQSPCWLWQFQYSFSRPQTVTVSEKKLPKSFKLS